MEHVRQRRQDQVSSAWAPSSFAVGDAVFSRPDIRREGSYAEYIAVHRISRCGDEFARTALYEAAHCASCGAANGQACAHGA
jgi:NADPH:quinone reductase-like Zn-dependent oxidoreductase